MNIEDYPYSVLILEESKNTVDPYVWCRNKFGPIYEYPFLWYWEWNNEVPGNDDIIYYFKNKSDLVEFSIRFL